MSLQSFNDSVLPKKISEEVAWVLKLPVPISYSHIVQKKIIFWNALIILNTGTSINCPIFNKIFSTLADPWDLADPHLRTTWESADPRLKTTDLKGFQ